MEKGTVILVACLVACLMILSGTLGFKAGYEQAPKGMITTKFVDVEVLKYVYVHTYSRNEVEEVANTLAATHFYIPDVYDCTEFSEALVRQLSDRGYECGVVHGTHNGTPHDYVWVKVHIEATNGHIINSSQMKLYGE